MNDQHRIRISLSLSAVLAAVVCALIYFVVRKAFEQEITNLLLLIAGMLSAASLSMLSRAFDMQGMSGGRAIYFDEDRARKVVDQVIDAEYKEVRHIGRENINSWEPTADSLLGQDPTLALAKMRIDLERELRRIASSNGMPIDARKISMLYLLEGLSRKNVISHEIVTAIKEVLPVCNAAIHGGNVRLEVAAQVLDIGDDILQVLRRYENTTADVSKGADLNSAL